MKQFKLPDVGEGLTEAEIVSWKVKPGDTVRVNDIVVEIETAKSLVELPSPFAGVVAQLLVDEGSTVEVGTAIIAVDTGDGPDTGEGGLGGDAKAESASEAAPAPPSRAATPGSESLPEPGLIGGPAPGGRTSVLVGYGPRTTSATRLPRKAAAGPSSTAPAAAAALQAVQASMMTTPRPPVELPDDVAEHPPAADLVEPHPAGPPGAGASGDRARVLAKPPVRKLARDLGVDLAALSPSGSGGLVTRADVEAAAAGHGAEGTSDRRETRSAVTGVRKMTARAMVFSAFTAPHVTEWVTVDVTRSMELVDRLATDPEFADVKVGPLLLVAKALLLAVRRNPGINASWDEDAQEIVVKHYVNLGVAAATPRGLLVPNIKDADRLPLHELAQALAALTTTAREGRTQPAEMAGGTITITNVGVFGVDAGTPILNPGEAAILCLGAVRDQSWVHEGAIAIRKVTQLALSFDHRLVDGQLGSQFLADIARVLEDPATALLW